MMLGKRPRPPMRRTTSMSGITVDFAGVEAPAPSDPLQNPPIIAEREEKERCDQSLLSMVSPRLSHRRNSWSDRISETADFLRTCGLCNRRLAPARDIYMYRGDAAFCSVECREQQIKQDETKNGNCSAAAGAATSKITPTKRGVTSSHSPAM